MSINKNTLLMSYYTIENVSGRYIFTPYNRNVNKCPGGFNSNMDGLRRKLVLQRSVDLV